MALKHRIGRSDEGTAILEMTLVMPLLLLLLGGFTEFGRMLHHHQQVEAAVRDAARFLARAPLTGTAPSACGGESFGSYTTAARNLALYGSTTVGTESTVPYWKSEEAGSTTFCIAGPTDRTVTSGGATVTVPVVSVTVNLTYQDTGLLGLVGVTAPTLTAVHEQRWIGE